MNKENILEIDNLERSYSTVMPDGETKVYSVLRGISFQVKRGEFIGIMGSSGCGKTTLLKTIGMLNKPNGGKVLYNGEDTTEIYGDHLAEIRRTQLAFVFQDFYLMNSLTVRENIMMPSPMMWMETDQYSKLAENYLSGKELQEEISHYEQKGDSILVDVSIEGFDDGLFDKLTVVKGSLEPLSDPDSHAIAVAVSTDDYGNIVNLDNYPELGDTYTVNYQIGYDIDSRTGERADQQTTPEEYLEYHEEEAKEVEYSVCALVTVPDSISFRYTSLGYSMVLPVEKLKEDSGTDVIPKFYMFDTPDSQAEASAEQYLQKLTAGDTSTLMYESKASIRREFTRFKNMFLICGGALCAIIGLVGILNFFNAIMTGILSRKREFAVLQSVGMTKRQLKLMLIYEGLFYAVGSIIASLILSVVLSPMLGNMMSAMFWFVTYHFTIMPVILIIPVFLLLGWLIPAVLYHAGKRQSIVENLREL